MGKFDKFKSLLGLEDEYDDDEYYERDYLDEDYYDDVRDYDEPEIKEEYSEPVSTSNRYKKNNVVPFNDNYSSDRVKILIHEPISYEDAPPVLDDILSKNVVVLNLEMLDIDIKRKTFDFVSGGIYALDGKIQKVSKDIFVIAPKELEIDGKLKDQIASKGFYQL
ncbi:cell division protein SepF [Mediannikoviicoccus vaginalis]|uniref:cell division protein SepF n=1 Tax=Mediannikoviicoccus vaginalis TaxID=2899727 RepID=UPI001F168484|nr:cell division protein SepF [Mediannikoviicoccus vaginalis]